MIGLALRGLLVYGIARLILLPLQVWDDVQRALADDPWDVAEDES